MLAMYLTFDGNVFTDLAAAPNPIVAGAYVKEGSPDCSTCPTAQYVSQNCTHNTDRVCAACTRCGSGTFTRQTCSTYFDATCQACGVCPMGSYSSTVCGANADVNGVSTQDVGCSACGTCDYLHYEAFHCNRTANVICNSCMSCRFTSESISAYCQVTTHTHTHTHISHTPHTYHTHHTSHTSHTHHTHIPHTHIPHTTPTTRPHCAPCLTTILPRASCARPPHTRAHQGDAGVQVLGAGEVDRENIKYGAQMDRHQWAFAKTR